MKLFKINEYEKIVSEDLNDLQKSIHQSLYDKILYPFLQRKDGFLGDSFTASRGSSSTVTIKAGRGFMWDAAQTGTEPKYRALELGSDLTLTVGADTWAAAPVTDSRIDIIVVRPKSETTLTSQRYIKTNGTGPIALQTVDKVVEHLYEIDVVEGTENAVPVAPATPAGWLKIAEVLLAPAGIVDASDVVDTREVLLPAITSFQSETRFVSPSGLGTDTTLNAAIANLPPEGGSIFLLESISLAAVHTLPANSAIKGRSRGIVINMEAGAKLVMGESCDLRDVSFDTEEEDLTFVEVDGNYCNIEKVNFSAPESGENIYIKVNSDGNAIEKCVFKKTVLPGTNTGIEFSLGSTNNSEEKNIFTD